MRALHPGEWRTRNGEGTTSADPSRPAVGRSRVGPLAVGGCALWLSACGLGIGFDDARAGLSCIDDSPHCVRQRQATLQAMLADKERKWVREAATPHAHASGVRLFAFRSAKAQLTCEELLRGRREAESAPRALRAQQGLSPAQVSRASLFAAEVQRELAAEMSRRRCRV